MNLKQKRTLLTRDIKGCQAWAEHITQSHGIPIIYPCIEIQAEHDSEQWQSLVNDMDRFDWIVFSSSNAVEFFWQVYSQQHVSLPEKIKVGCVGLQTQTQLENLGIHSDLMAQPQRAQGLVDIFPTAKISSHVLFPKGDLAKDTIPKGLISKGYQVTEFIVYRNKFPQSLSPFAECTDAILFASPSAVRHFFTMNHLEQLNNAQIISIGPSTSHELKKLNINGYLEAKNPDLESMLDLIE